MQKFVDGYVDSKFTKIEKAFISIIDNMDFGGASVSIYVDGIQVVDLFGGESQLHTPWNQSTLSLTYSCTKGISSIVVAQLIEAGSIAPENAVADYWPEFASISKTLTVRDLMGHKSGLAALKEDLELDQVLNHRLILEQLFNQGPLWVPGTNHAYHAFTFGNLVEELVHQVTGQSVSTLFLEQIAIPLGIEAWIGLPADKNERVALLQSETPPLDSLPEKGSLADLGQRALSFGNAFPLNEALQYEKGFNLHSVHQAQLPGVNLITNATGLSKIWSATVIKTDGIRLLNDNTIETITQPVSTGQSSWQEPGPWPSRGMGVMLNNPARNPLTSVRSFGHEGFGGQVGFADPENKVGFAFLTNNLQIGEQEHARWSLLVSELKKILAS